MNSALEMKKSCTNRGFWCLEFEDLYDSECIIQESSLATDDAIWIGIKDANPQVMASQAHSLGVETSENCGWVPYPIPRDVLLTTRMHINREQSAQLIEVLQHFVDT